MAGITLLDRQGAVRDLESRLRHALLIARLGGEQLVSRDGRLLIIRLLGYGASGVVCEALDRKLGRKVALKLYPGLAQDALARAVRTEAQVLAALRHRNIVVVHDFDADEFRPGDLRCFLVVMELLSGTTLRHWMAVPHPAAEVLDVFCRAGDGLAAAHTGGIVHRDFKPENVMLDQGGEPRLVDFGLAILDTPAAGHLDSKNPEQRAIVGTLAYMAPEALRGRADARSDQFSFAAALWEALCGEFPYPIDDLDPGKRVVTAAPTSARRLPPALFDCLRRALHLDPNRRFPKMADLVARLRELLGEVRSAASLASAPAIHINADLSSDTHQSAATAPVAVVSRRSWGWLAFPAVGAAAVVGVLSAAGFWGTAPTEPPEAEQPPEEATATVVAAPDTAPPPETPPPPPPPAAAPFACPTQAVKGVWLFKTLALKAKPDKWRDKTGLYAIDLEVSDPGSCRFAATLYKSRGKQHFSKHGTIDVREFPPHLGVGVGDFELDGFRYEFFFAFEDGQLRGDFHAQGSELGHFSGLLRGGRNEDDRNKDVSDDQPCAARCRSACGGANSLARCRAQCSGDRDAEPRCSPP